MKTVAPISVTEYHRMIDDGAFSEKKRVELVDGIIVEKEVQKPPHASVIDSLNDMIRTMIANGVAVRIQSPITLSESEPEPDICVAFRHDPAAFHERHPGPADCGLVIEVSDSSLAFDRTAKLKMYARDGVAPYWIASVADRTIEVYEVPNGTREEPVFKTKRVYKPGEVVPFFLNGEKRGEIAVSDVFPSKPSK